MINPVVETRRQAYLELLYKRSGRSCGTYTGLYLNRIQELINQDIERQLNDSAE